MCHCHTPGHWYWCQWRKEDKKCSGWLPDSGNLRSSFSSWLTGGCELSKTLDRLERLEQVGEEMSCSPNWPVHGYNGEWTLTVKYFGLNAPSQSATVPDVLELQYDLKSRAAKWCHHWDCQCVFLYSFSSRVQATVSFYLEWHPVHLEAATPEVEAQSYHLPWTDVGCTGKEWGSRVPGHL